MSCFDCFCGNDKIVEGGPSKAKPKKQATSWPTIAPMWSSTAMDTKDVKKAQRVRSKGGVKTEKRFFSF